jgi:hypothetical protein
VTHVKVAFGAWLLSRSICADFVVGSAGMIGPRQWKFW